MMNITMVFCMLLSLALKAGITFDKEQPKSSEEKVMADTKKALAGADIKNVTARLKVEGASFRRFNLYFPETKIVANSSAQNRLAREIRAIVDRDLEISGGFSLVSHPSSSASEALMKQKGAEGITTLTLTIKPDVVSAHVEHKNLGSGQKDPHDFSANHKGLRRLAHQIAQSIYESYIGKENLFMLQMAAVKREGSSSQIVLMDFDGHSESAISEGTWSKASPYFSPDGKTILYGVISPKGQGIVEQDIASKKMVFRTKKQGINLDPRVMPDNSGLLATLSFEGNANIYRLSRSGAVVHKMTKGLGLSLSPSISPNGKLFAFVSDRTGTPQIYVQELSPTASADKLKIPGKYNQTPHFNHDGTLITFTGRDENKVFDIFIFDRLSERVTRVTENQGRNQEPFFSPSGRFVIFTSEREGKRKPDIFIATLNGNHQYRLTNANSDAKSQGYYSPVFRPEQK